MQQHRHTMLWVAARGPGYARREERKAPKSWQGSLLPTPHRAQASVGAGTAALPSALPAAKESRGIEDESCIAPQRRQALVGCEWRSLRVRRRVGASTEGKEGRRTTRPSPTALPPRHHRLATRPVTSLCPRHAQPPARSSGGRFAARLALAPRFLAKPRPVGVHGKPSSHRTQTARCLPRCTAARAGAEPRSAQTPLALGDLRGTKHRCG